MYILGVVIDIIGLLLFFIGVYYLAVAFFSLIPRAQLPKEVKRNRYAVVIPAHNEEKVIGGLIKSINAAEYPEGHIAVFVVADGCADATAVVAEKMGAEVLIKEKSSDKGSVLRFAFSNEKIKNGNFDCVAVFDADNIVSPRFFVEADEKLANGALAVQGYIDSKNPYSSWVSNAHSIWYWLTNRISQAGRAKLGLGARLGGTGFVLKYELLNRVPWATCSYAEDMEYTCILAENNIRIDYAEKAVVYDEKPEDLAASVRQRSRWAKGVCDVQGEYTFRFLLKGRLNDLLGMWNDVLSPMVFVLLILIKTVGVGGIWQTVPGAAVLWFYVTAYVLVSVAALITDKKLSYKTVLNTFGFLIYMLSWLPSGILGVFCKNSNKWQHTLHKRKID